MATEAIDFTALETPGADTGASGTDTTETDNQQGTGADELRSTEHQETQSKEPGTEDQQIDGRRGPANIRNSIKAAAEAIPEQAAAFKELGNSYFREQQYRQHFATPQEAATAKQLIEGIGGIEGASSLQERVQAYDTQESGLESGDPAVLDSFFEDYPKQAVQLAGAYLERVNNANPQAFAELIGPHAVDLVVKAGLAEALQQAFEADDPKPIIQRMYNWLAQQQQNRQTVQQSSTQKNPASDRIAQERQELQQEKETMFRSSVSERVNSVAEPAVATEVERYAKQYKLNEAQKTHYRKALVQAVIEEMNGDKTYNNQVDLRYANKSRTRETVASYIAGEFNRRLKDKAFEVVKGIYGAPRTAPAAEQAGPVKAGQPQTAPGGGPLKINFIPGNDQLDTSRPNFDLMRIRGQGYLKGSNRFVSWSHLR